MNNSTQTQQQVSNETPFDFGHIFGILDMGCFRSKQQCKTFMLFKMKHLYLYID